MEAPPEKYAFVAALNAPGSSLNEALLVVDMIPGHALTASALGRLRCQSLATSCIIRLECVQFGSLSVRPDPHVERRYLLCLGCAHLASHYRHEANPPKTEDNQSDGAGEVFARTNYSRYTRFTAGRKAFTLARLERPMRRPGRHFNA